MSFFDKSSAEEVKRQERKATVVKLYCEGKTQAEIAKVVGVSVPTVGKDIKQYIDEWKARADFPLDELKAEELAKINRLEQEAWEAWYRSIGTAKTVKKRKRLTRVQTNKINRTEPPIYKMMPLETLEDETTRELVGEPKFLETVQWCVETRCKIYGLIKPEQKIQNNNFIGMDQWEKILSVPDDNTSEDDIERRIREVKEVKQITSTQPNTPEEDVAELPSNSGKSLDSLSNILNQLIPEKYKQDEERGSKPTNGNGYTGKHDDDDDDDDDEYDSVEEVTD